MPGTAVAAGARRAGTQPAPPVRGRARQRVLDALGSLGGVVVDERGRANAALRAAAGYEGSGVAFAQLLAGMERAGLISRETQAKRTYRIALRDSSVGDPGAAPAPAPAGKPARWVAGGPTSDVDYDRLATALLRSVVAASAAAGAAGPERDADDTLTSLQLTVSELEDQLLQARAESESLRRANRRLRSQLDAALRRAGEREGEQSLSSRLRGQLDESELALLERLLETSSGDVRQSRNAG